MHFVHSRSPYSWEDINNFVQQGEFWLPFKHVFSPRSRTIRLLERAKDLATEVHHGDIRFNGEPYINHPCRATLASLLIAGERDPDILAALLCHDTVEDHGQDGCPSWRVHKHLGSRPGEMVDAVTGPSKIGLEKHRSARTALKFAKIRAYGRGAVAVKCPDRWDNLYTLPDDEVFCARQRKETKQYLMPLARKYNIMVSALEQALNVML